MTQVRQLYQLFHANEFEKFNEYLSSIDEKTIKNKDIRGFRTLKLKFYLINDNIEMINQMISENLDELMKRDILLIVKYFYPSKKSFELFDYLLANHQLQEKNIDFLIENDLKECLKKLDGYYYHTNLTNSDNVLEKRVFNEEIKKTILTQIEDKLFYIPTIQKENPVIIDAGNVIHNCKGEKTKKGFTNLEEITEKIIKMNCDPVIVIHQKHLGNKTLNKLKKYIIPTPAKQNDDWYILYLGLFYQAPIITNDKFYDHIEEFKYSTHQGNMTYYYLNDLITNYQGHNFEIQNNTRCIQIKDKIVIPSCLKGVYLI
jgi:DNA-directed RNA polymerase subunit H (RpoH/RPB5)